MHAIAGGRPARACGAAARPRGRPRRPSRATNTARLPAHPLPLCVIPHPDPIPNPGSRIILASREALRPDPRLQRDPHDRRDPPARRERADREGDRRRGRRLDRRHAREARRLGRPGRRARDPPRDEHGQGPGRAHGDGRLARARSSSSRTRTSSTTPPSTRSCCGRSRRAAPTSSSARALPGSAEHRVQNFWHQQGNRLLTLISNVVTGLNVSDMATCYKAFHRRVVPSLDLESRGFGIDAEITAKIARGGFRVFEVPVSYFGRSRAEGKKIRLKDGFSAISAPGPALAPGRPEALSAAGLDRGGARDHRARRSSRCATTRGATRSRPTSRSTSSSGYLEVFGRTAIVNIEHPPLMKALAGLGLAGAAAAAAARADPDGRALHADFGHAFLFENPVVARRDRRGRARARSSPCSPRCSCWCSSRRGRATATAPALFALSLVALDPNLVAHAGVVHTDLGAALAFLATVLAWDRAWREPVRRARRGRGARPGPRAGDQVLLRLPRSRSCCCRRSSAAGRAARARARRGPRPRVLGRRARRRGRRRPRRLRPGDVADGPRRAAPDHPRDGGACAARPALAHAREPRGRLAAAGALPRRARRASRGRTRSAEASTSCSGSRRPRAFRPTSSWRFWPRARSRSCC